MFVPLHVRSACTLGFGVIRPEALASAAARLGFDAIALTDRENLYGLLDFHEAARESGVRPLTGATLELPAVPGGLFSDTPQRVVLLVRNEQGFANLCQILSRRNGVGKTELSITRVLRGRTDGLFVMSDSPVVLEDLLAADMDSDALRALVVRPTSTPANGRALVELCRNRSIRPVADLDVVLLSTEDLPLHELRVAAARGEPLQVVRDARLTVSADRVLLPPHEVEALFADLPEAVAESRKLADACDFDPWQERVTVESSSRVAHHVLAKRAHAALLERIPAPQRAPYLARLEHELNVIAERRFAGYFLTVDRIAAAARDLGIGIAARGSAVSSLVAYLLQISAVDPLVEGLVFERFLNPFRPDSPDVDLDVASDRREELIDRMYRDFGRRHTATVGALHTAKDRTAYREGLVALGMSAQEAATFVRRIRDRPGDDEPPYVPVDLLPPPYRNAAPLIEQLVGLPHHFSAHPGGLVIADEPIDRLLPLERAGKGIVATQFDLRAVKQRGLVKIDLLGNHALSELAMVADLVSTNGTVRWDDAPPDDPATLALLDRAETIGCFQVESPAVRSVLRRLPVRSVADVTVALALVRPGAGSGQAKQAFLRRALGKEPVRASHPIMAEVLAETHGLLLFEEDVIRLIAHLTGRPLAWADRLRAAILDGRGVDAARQLFLEESQTSIDLQSARSIWRDLEKLAAYTFSRAHAASYAKLAYLAAFAKVHHPVEFMAALITHHGGLYPLRSVVAEMMRRGVRMLRPSANQSALQTMPMNGGVLIGLEKIKYLTRSTAQRIIDSRSESGAFRDLPDFLERIRPSRRELEALVLCGACDGLPPLVEEGYPHVHEHFLADARAPGAEKFVIVGGDEARYRRLVRVRNELRFLEMHVEAHPMEILRPDASELGAVSTTIADRQPARRVKVAGLIAAARVIRAREGPMQFFTLEDEHGTLECSVPPRVFRHLGNRITTPGPFVAIGTIREELGDVHLEIEGLEPFHERARRNR